MDTDTVMIQTWITMHDHFSKLAGFPFGLMPRHRDALQRGDIAGFRNERCPQYHEAPVDIFFYLHQLQHLFKRYTFRRDACSPDDRKVNSLRDFVRTQYELENSKITEVGRMILAKMRPIVTDVIGEFVPLEEVLTNMEQGKRAAVGLESTNAHDFCMRYDAGSHTVGQSVLMRELWRRSSLRHLAYTRDYWKTRMPVDALHAVAVPKKYNVDRIIMPNTTIGALVTSGLGRVIEDRLSYFGINLSTQPDLHKVLAERSSITRHLVTADLSKASDLITEEHIRAIVPDEWFHLLSSTRVPLVWVDKKAVDKDHSGLVVRRTKQEKLIRMNTFMTMGVGYTFPLQTLVFRSLLEVLRREFNIRGRISVYGDDLIYPYRLHIYVEWAFRHLGFRLNTDKTCVDVDFRESCGGDYFRGLDVRPHMPEDETIPAMIGSAPNLRFTEFLHKLINGLRTRNYSDDDIRPTLNYLLTQLYHQCGPLMWVPKEASEGEGIYEPLPDLPDGVTLSPVCLMEEPWGEERVMHKHVGCSTKYVWAGPVDRDADLIKWFLDHRRTPRAPLPWEKEVSVQLVWRKPPLKYRRFEYSTDENGKRRKRCLLEPYFALPGRLQLSARAFSW